MVKYSDFARAKLIFLTKIQQAQVHYWRCTMFMRFHRVWSKLLSVYHYPKRRYLSKSQFQMPRAAMVAKRFCTGGLFKICNQIALWPLQTYKLCNISLIPQTALLSKFWQDFHVLICFGIALLELEMLAKWCACFILRPEIAQGASFLPIPSNQH